MINIYIAKVLHTWNAHYCILSIIINFRPWNAPSSLFCVQAPPPPSPSSRALQPCLTSLILSTFFISFRSFIMTIVMVLSMLAVVVHSVEHASASFLWGNQSILNLYFKYKNYDISYISLIYQPCTSHSNG